MEKEYNEYFFTESEMRDYLNLVKSLYSTNNANIDLIRLKLDIFQSVAYSRRDHMESEVNIPFINDEIDQKLKTELKNLFANNDFSQVQFIENKISALINEKNFMVAMVS